MVIELTGGRHADWRAYYRRKGSHVPSCSTSRQSPRRRRGCRTTSVAPGRLLRSPAPTDRARRPTSLRRTRRRLLLHVPDEMSTVVYTSCADRDNATDCESAWTAPAPLACLLVRRRLLLATRHCNRLVAVSLASLSCCSSSSSSSSRSR